MQQKILNFLLWSFTTIFNETQLFSKLEPSFYIAIESCQSCETMRHDLTFHCFMIDGSIATYKLGSDFVDHRISSEMEVSHKAIIFIELEIHDLSDVWLSMWKKKRGI
jgi:hypothetical protein